MKVTGLKISNFIAGVIEFSPRRIKSALSDKKIDLALYEYWHAYKSARIFKEKGVKTVLDMHNVLLQTYILGLNKGLSPFLKKYYTSNYKKTEKQAWLNFDGIIAINKNEYQHVKKTLPEEIKIFQMGMGVNLSNWMYTWSLPFPPKLAYYGASSEQNKRNILFCIHHIMPAIWKNFSDAEFWIIGSNPGEELLKLPNSDSRIHVTGYVKEINVLLGKMSILLCPWKGKYGFRSRIIEVMASGLPVICSRDAVDGMELDAGKGIYFAETEMEFESLILDFLNNNKTLNTQSILARKQVEDKYAFESTYAKGIADIYNWLSK